MPAARPGGGGRSSVGAGAGSRLTEDRPPQGASFGPAAVGFGHRRRRRRRLVLYCIVLYCIVGHDSVYVSCEYKLGLRSWKSELMPYVVPISTESVPFRVLCVMSSCFRSPTDVPSSYFLFYFFRVRQTMAVVFRPLR